MLRSYLTLPRAVYVLCLGTFISRLGTMFVPFLAIYLGKHLGYSDQFATLALGCLGLGAVGGALLGGQLADQFGRRGVMVAALFGSALVILGYSLVRSPWMLLAGAALYTLIGDMYRPAAQALIADLVRPEQRPHAYALMYMSINLGFGIGPWIGGELARYSYTLIFVANAVALAAFGLIVLLAIGKADPSRAGADLPVSPLKKVSFGAAMRHVAGDSTFLIFLAGTFFISLVYMQSMSTFPLYLAKRGIGEDVYGRIIAVNGLMIAAGQIFVAGAVARLPRGWMLVWGALLTALGFALKGAADAEWAFRGSVMIWTLGEMVQAAVLSPLVVELAPPALRARYMGMIGIAYSGANALGAPLGGVLLGVLPGGAIWLVIAGAALTGALLYATIALRLSAPSVRAVRARSDARE